MSHVTDEHVATRPSPATAPVHEEDIVPETSSVTGTSSKNAKKNAKKKELKKKKAQLKQQSIHESEQAQTVLHSVSVRFPATDTEMVLSAHHWPPYFEG